jgi:hypothetical protein
MPSICVNNASIYVLLLILILTCRVNASQTPLLSPMSITNHTRIRLKSTEDIVKGYLLLLDYLETPSHAYSVKEFVFDKPHQGTSGSCFSRLPPGDDEAPKLHEIVNDIDYSREENKIIGALDRLGLSKGLEIPRDKEHPHTEAVKAIKKWRYAHIAQVRSADGQKSAWQKYWSENKAVNGAFAQILAPLLISFSPNIEKLKLTLLDRTTQEFFCQVNYGLLPPTCLQNVKQVVFGPSKNGAFWQYDERFFTGYDLIGMARLVHKLPSLESISVEGTSFDQNGLDMQPPGASSLKRLHIGHSDMSSSTLSSLIRMAKALEYFTFSVGGRATNDGGHSIVKPKTIAKSLLVHRESLKSLDIDVDDYLHGNHLRFRQPSGLEDEAPEDEDGLDRKNTRRTIEWELKHLREDPYFNIDEAEAQALGLPLQAIDLPNTRKYGGTIGSLHDFLALTELTIGIKLLLGPQEYNTTTREMAAPPPPFRLINALPPNLKHLCIRGYKHGIDKMWDDQIAEFRTLKAEKLPALKTVVGIEEEVAGGKVVQNPDHNEDLLWKEPRAEEDRWEEWGIIKNFWDDVDG